MPVITTFPVIPWPICNGRVRYRSAYFPSATTTGRLPSGSSRRSTTSRARKIFGAGGDLLQHRREVEGRGDLAADTVQRLHLARAALGLGMQLRGLDGGARIGGDGRQQAQGIIR